MRASRSVFAFLAAVTALSCGSEEGDKPAVTPPPSALGTSHIRDILNPESAKRAKSNDVVTVTGASVVAVDNFDETRNGKSRGTIYIQDFGSKEPYSGISLFSPTFVPSDLKVAPGDVLDFYGPYQENGSIGTAVFPAGQLLVQLAHPVGTFRFETTPAEPVDIDVNDLKSYDTGKKWVGMLVRVKNLKLLNAPFTDKSNRVTIQITDGVPKDAASIDNELMDLPAGDFKKDQVLQSVTGVVTYFFTLKIAPRSNADIVR
jgi:hypothetical protein